MANKQQQPNDSWSTGWANETPSFELDDPIGKLASLPPYKKSEDKKGHGVNLQAWFPRNYSRRIEVIKQAGKGVYETTADVVRDAISLGVHVLETRFNCDPEWELDAQLDHLRNVAAHDAYVYERESDFVDEITKLVANREEDRAVELLQMRFGLLNSKGGTGKSKEALIESLRKNRLSHLLEKCKVS